jgi:hypothetical protein
LQVLANAEEELIASRKFRPRFRGPRRLDNLRTARDQLLASIERTQAQITQKSSTRRGRQARPAQHFGGSYVAPGQKVVWLRRSIRSMPISM